MINILMGILMAANIIGVWECPGWFWPFAIIYCAVAIILGVVVLVLKAIQVFGTD